MESFGKDRLQAFRDEFTTNTFAAFGGPLRHNQSTAAQGSEKTFRLQLQISPGDGVGIKRQLLAELPDAGEELSGHQRFFGDGVFYLPQI